MEHARKTKAKITNIPIIVDSVLANVGIPAEKSSGGRLVWGFIFRLVKWMLPVSRILFN